MNKDIFRLDNQQLRQVYLQERIRFSNGLDQRLPWNTLKEICHSLSEIGNELKKREKQ